MKPKVGDLVRLKPLLVEAVGTGICDDVLVAGGFSLNVNRIEEILPRPLTVDDRVTLTIGGDCPSSVHGEIIAAKNDRFWVLHDYGFATVRGDELRRAEGA